MLTNWNGYDILKLYGQPNNRTNLNNPMTKKFKFAVRKCFLVLFFSLGLFSCDGYREITIGIVGDQFGAYDAEKSYQVMQQAVDKLCAKNPDVILHVGDIVESIRGIDTFEDFESNFRRAVTIMNGTQKPWLIALGDHDVVPPRYLACSPDRSREKWFMDCCQRYETPVGDKPYYSKNVAGYHFISLYSMENLHTDPRWGSIFLNKIKTEQLSWLKDDLEENKSSKGIIVLIHHPQWYVWSNWMEIHGILREYPVIAVIAGHYHYDQDDGLIDGIRYIVMGASGGVVKDTDAHSGGAQEYGLLKLKKDKITAFNLFEVNSDSMLELTPRRSMDRLQAISCMLDNLWKDVNLVASDGEKSLQKSDLTKDQQIILTSLANPIDIPIEISIEFPDTLLTDPVWNAGDSTISGYEPIKLKPGERISWANYSNVGQWYQPPALWQAKIISDAKENTQITLSVLVKLQDTRQRFIRHAVIFNVN
ncbi:MAG: hypothetical protein DRP96_00195 [Candidatus Neomarinimicrobiota bacterium]|nr:MAG: hypothetical protein DRP96_00195 [Candidatus Neomarinimicrobiota bacterium]